MKKFFAFLTVCFGLFLLTSASWAQSNGSSLFQPNDDDGTTTKSVVNQYDTRYKVLPKISGGSNNSLVSPNQYNIRFVRHPQEDQDKVILRISALGSIQGCLMGGFNVTSVEKEAQRLIVTVEKPMIEVDQSVANPHYSCPGSGATPSIDVPLELKELRAEGIDELRLVAGFTQEKFNLYIDDSMVELSPKGKHKAFLSTSKNGAVTHYFYPQGTLILQAPLARKDPDLKNKLVSIASQHHLSPLPMMSDQPGKFFFVDNGGKLIDKLQEQHIILLDTIDTNEVLIGKDGPYTVSRAVDVLASAPSEID